EAVEHDGADVELAGLVHALEALGDRRRLVVLETAPPDPLDGVDDQVAELAAQHVAPLAPDAQDLDLLAGLAQLAHAQPRAARDRGVEAAAQAAIRGRDHD